MMFLTNIIFPLSVHHLYKSYCTMMFLTNIIFPLSVHHLYNVCGVFACVWYEVTHPLTNSNFRHNVLAPLNLLNIIYE